MTVSRECPFCGNDVVTIRDFLNGKVAFGCPALKNDALTCHVMPQTRYFSTFKEAQAAWNERSNKPSKPRGRRRNRRTFSHLGEAIREARIDAGLNQKALADRLNVHPSHLSKLETGLVRPNPQTLNRIAEALGKRPIIVFEDENYVASGSMQSGASCDGLLTRVATG